MIKAKNLTKWSFSFWKKFGHRGIAFRLHSTICAFFQISAISFNSPQWVGQMIIGVCAQDIAQVREGVQDMLVKHHLFSWEI